MTDAQIESIGKVVAKHWGRTFVFGSTRDNHPPNPMVWVKGPRGSTGFVYEIRPDGLVFDVRGLTATVVEV